MREFAQVMPTFWTGDTGKAIKGKPELQVLAFYLITNPHANALGLYYLPIPFITHETGLTEKKVLDGFRKLGAFCKYDPISEFVWVVGMAGYQLGNLKPTDNKMKGLLRAWQGLPPNPFTGDFWAKYGERYGFERRASKGLVRAVEGLRSDTETETDTEMDTETDTPAPAKAVAARAPSTDQARFIETFGAAYTQKTGQPFKADKKDFVLVAGLIKSYGLPACIEKAQVLGMLCELRSAWFTKDEGFGAFTIGKLSSQWNSILPPPEPEGDAEMKRQEALRARADQLLRQ